MLLIGFISSICISCTLETLAFNLKWTDWILITVHSGTYGLKIPLEMHVASRLPGVVIAVIASTSIIYGWIAQYTFLKHIHSGYMNWVEICGICCVIVASIIPSVVKSCTSWLTLHALTGYKMTHLHVYGKQKRWCLGSYDLYELCGRAITLYITHEDSNEESYFNPKAETVHFVLFVSKASWLYNQLSDMLKAFNEARISLFCHQSFSTYCLSKRLWYEKPLKVY